MEHNRVYEILINTRETDLARISSLDSTILTIKGWAVTLVTVLIGLAIQQQTRAFLYLGIGIIPLFAMFDCFYRRIQLQHVRRVIEIEKYLKTEYLNDIESLKQILKPFYVNPGRNVIKDYLISVFLVYLIMLLTLLILAIAFPTLFQSAG